MKGLDYIDELGLKIHKEVELKWYQVFWRKLVGCLKGLAPLTKEVNKISAAQIKSIASFFKFFRGLVTAGVT